MKNTPQLSVIIPIYNVEKYLDFCIKSILSQSSTSLEIILVDDGSPDQCGEICDRYASTNTNITVIHQENQGVAAARNAGLAAASGEYLIWVDPDDWVSDGWFRRISETIERYAPDVILFDMARVKGERVVPEIYGRPAGPVDQELLCCDVARDIRMLSGLPNKVIRAKHFEGIRFDTKLGILEDYDAMLPLLQRAKSVFYIDEVLYFYRQHEESLLHQHSPERSMSSVRVAERRWRNAPEYCKDAAVVGVAVQALLYCRAAAYDSRFCAASQDFQYCKKFIQQNLKRILKDREVPVIWKLKFMLMATGLLIPLVKWKYILDKEV